MSVPARETSGITFSVDSVTQAKDLLKCAPLLEDLQQRLRLKVLLAPEAQQPVCYSGGVNPLLWAIHCAFSQHRPLILSPDHVWLTIEQGFGHHISENAEELRHRLVRHQGRKELHATCFPTLQGFESAVASFSSQIRDATDPVLYETLVCDFSTTTPIVRTASEIALMSAYSTYFEYMLGCVCGIPSVTLQGTSEDWRRIRARVEVLAVYDLEWWVSRLRPILDQLVQTAEGNPTPDFWKGIYKPFEAYAVTAATGWITDLFPYLGEASDRRRSHVFAHERQGWALPVDEGVDMRQLGPTATPGESVPLRSFPCGLSNAPVALTLPNGSQIDVDFIAGMLALLQNPDTLGLSPLISWCVAEKPPAAPVEEHSDAFMRFMGGYRHRRLKLN